MCFMQLARNGVVAIGRITKCLHGSKGGIFIAYDFRDMNGMLTVGSGEYPTQLENDAQVCILYLPEESWRSRPYPLVFFRVVK
jgi:hypothetical protein